MQSLRVSNLEIILQISTFPAESLWFLWLLSWNLDGLTFFLSQRNMLSFWPPTPPHFLVHLLSLLVSLRMSQHEQPSRSFGCTLPGWPRRTNYSWRQRWELRQTSPQRSDPFSITMRPIFVPIYICTNRFFFFSLAGIKIIVSQLSCFNTGNAFLVTCQLVMFGSVCLKNWLVFVSNACS